MNTQSLICLILSVPRRYGVSNTRTEMVGRPGFERFESRVGVAAWNGWNGWRGEPYLDLGYCHGDGDGDSGVSRGLAACSPCFHIRG